MEVIYKFQDTTKENYKQKGEVYYEEISKENYVSSYVISSI